MRGLERHERLRRGHLELRRRLQHPDQDLAPQIQFVASPNLRSGNSGLLLTVTRGSDQWSLVLGQLHRPKTKRNGQTRHSFVSVVAAGDQADVSCALSRLRGAGGLRLGVIVRDSRNTSKKW